MARRGDRPRLEVRESFETSRLGPQCLIEAYARLVPIPIRRTGVRAGRNAQERADTLVRRSGGRHA